MSRQVIKTKGCPREQTIFIRNTQASGVQLHWKPSQTQQLIRLRFWPRWELTQDLAAKDTGETDIVDRSKGGSETGETGGAQHSTPISCPPLPSAPAPRGRQSTMMAAPGLPCYNVLVAKPWVLPFQCFNEWFVPRNCFHCTLSATAPNTFKEWLSRRKHQLLSTSPFFCFPQIWLSINYHHLLWDENIQIVLCLPLPASPCLYT